MASSQKEGIVVDFKIQVDDEEQKTERAASPKKQKKSPVHKLGGLRLNKKGKRLALVGVLLIILSGGFLFQMNRIESLKEENARLSDPQQSTQDETAQITSEVSQLIQLPDEAPTVATVVDVEKLQGQDFFVNAQNGDRVLLFAENKKAILYRPDAKKIIEVAPINIGDSQGQTAGESTSIPGTEQQTQQ